MNEVSEACPKQTKTGIAKRISDWLDNSPFIKLLSAAVVSVMALWGFADSIRREHEESQRGGWYDVPSVSLEFDSSGICRLTNNGKREIVEATIHLTEHYLDATDCSPAPMFFQRYADAEAHDLLPRAKLEAIYADDRRKMTCKGIDALTKACPDEHQCHHVITCKATFHRASDRKAFTKVRYVLVENGCETLVPLGNYAIGSDKGIEWKEPQYGRLAQCIKHRPPSETPPMQMFDDFDTMLYRHLESND